MSGGHFEYQQYRIEDIAKSIEELIKSNDDESLDEWGYRRGHVYSIETIEKFKTAVDTLRKAAIMAQRVDWLVSGDDGEDSFHRRWDEELKEIK
jgi:nicotinic acid mononucleotide adenylyltransferase